MRYLGVIPYLIFGVAIGFGLIVGVVKFIEWTQAPEQNRGYCIEIAYKTVYIPHSGWSDSDLEYNEKQVPYCVEWENYKP